MSASGRTSRGGPERLLNHLPYSDRLRHVHASGNALSSPCRPQLDGPKPVAGNRRTHSDLRRDDGRTRDATSGGRRGGHGSTPSSRSRPTVPARAGLGEVMRDERHLPLQGHAAARRPSRSIQLTRTWIGPVPDLPPQPERRQEVAVRQGRQGPHGQGFGTPVERTGAAGVGAGRRAVAALERGAGPAPVAGRGPFDRQHLAEVRPAAVAGRPAGMSGPAGRAAFHVRYSRWSRYSR